MYCVLLEMNALALLLSGRLTAENTAAGRALEKQAVQAMSLTGSVEKLTKQISKWIGADGTAIEMEITAAVIDALQGAYQLHITKLKDDLGRVLVEWDGVVSGSLHGAEVLVVVEAKHRVVEADITCPDPRNPGLIERLEVFKGFLDSVKKGPPENASSKLKAQYNLYKRYADLDLVGAIGGPHFSPSVRQLAKKNRLLFVYTDGSRYSLDV